MRFNFLVSLFTLIVLAIQFSPPVEAAPQISNVTDTGTTPKYEKFENSFQITNSTAQNFQLPYDPNPPNGLSPDLNPLHLGISVDAVFTSPSGETFQQPAFFYREYINNGPQIGWDYDSRRDNKHEWIYPTNNTSWKVRFAPHAVGNWSYYLKATDSSGTTQSSIRQFTVTASTNPGFLKVSSTDTRFFEFDNGEIFNPSGVHAGGIIEDVNFYGPPVFEGLKNNKLTFLRHWISSLYGEAWPQWIGQKNTYDGYLPRTGYLPLAINNQIRSTIYIDYEYSGDTGWFDACRMQFGIAPESVKQNTNYQLEVTYRGDNLIGPRDPTSPNYGIVAKITPQWLGNNCYQSQSAATNVTNYGGNTGTGTNTISGIWNSGNNLFLPRVYIALENVLPPSDTQKAWAGILTISLKEMNAQGTVIGPEIIKEPSSQSELYIPEYRAYSIDQYLDLLKEYGLYTKLVLMDKNDHLYKKLLDNGNWVSGGDNANGFYGCNPANTTDCPNQARTLNKTRWLQEAYYRYLQARWGYSTQIHSWELTNEGDPALIAHWQTTDELGKSMGCRVFGIQVARGDSVKCTHNHPNAHLVSTSFWHTFVAYNPSNGWGLWGNPQYPNVDHADGHAYISTSPARYSDKLRFEKDAAYFHLWHSREWGGWNFPFPVIRGESGMVPATGSTDDSTALGIQQDATGIWFHNWVFAQLHTPSMYELYWYYGNHIYNPPTYDHRPIHATYAQFLKNIPLNNGLYQDAAGYTITYPNSTDAGIETSPASSNQNLRVIGQKDTTSNRAHLWVQNKQHTWRNVLDGIHPTPQSGNITLTGFTPNTSLPIEWWSFATNPTTPQITTTTQTTTSQGSLILEITNLTKDTAIKIGNYNPTPSPTPISTFSLDNDSDVDIYDILILISRFTQNLIGDFNQNGRIDIFDFTTLIKNRL